jgi:hypothetical protein
MRERSIDIWKQKLDWVASNGGLVLVNVHPDYIKFGGGNLCCDEYPVELYMDFLSYVKSQNKGYYWHALPREVSRFWTKGFR